jgi:sugar phosphate isomerase/epimerase
MKHRPGQSRRQFLHESISAAAAVSSLSALVRAESQEAGKKPVWAIACRDAILREAGQPDIWSAMRAVGLDGIEATVNPDSSLPLLFGTDKAFSIADADGRKALSAELEKQGRKICAFCLHNRFDERPDEEIALTIKTARAASEMGIPAVRLDIVPRKVMDPDEFLKLGIRVGRKVTEATQDLPVRFGVENHGTTTNRPEFLRKLFGGVGTNRFGLTLDVGNFYWWGHPLSKVYDYFAEFAPWVCHVHCKNIRYPQADRERQREMGWKYAEYRYPIDQGDIDYARVVRILRKSGYRNDLCIDDESLSLFPKDQHGAILKRVTDYLRRMAQAE